MSVSWKLMVGGLLVWVLGVTPAQAQLRTQHIAGLTGLKGGSQPPSHVYVIAPLFYVYSTDEVKDRDGNRLRANDAGKRADGDGDISRQAAQAADP